MVDVFDVSDLYLDIVFVGVVGEELMFVGVGVILLYVCCWLV